MELLTVDESGRVLIPQEVRKQLGLSTQDRLSLEVKDGQLILKPLLNRHLTDLEQSPVNSDPEPETCYEDGVLVIKSEIVGDLEMAINELREERINELSAW